MFEIIQHTLRLMDKEKDTKTRLSLEERVLHLNASIGICAGIIFFENSKSDILSVLVNIYEDTLLVILENEFELFRYRGEPSRQESIQVMVDRMDSDELSFVRIFDTPFEMPITNASRYMTLFSKNAGELSKSVLSKNGFGMNHVYEGEYERSSGRDVYEKAMELLKNSANFFAELDGTDVMMRKMLRENIEERIQNII